MFAQVVLMVRLIEICIATLISALIVIEILVPVWRGTRMFPLLRSFLFSGTYRSAVETMKAQEEVDVAVNHRQTAELLHKRDDIEIEASHIAGTGPTVAEFNRQCQANANSKTRKK